MGVSGNMVSVGVASCTIVFLRALPKHLFIQYSSKVYRLAIMDSVTADSHTDGQTDDNIMPIVEQYDRLKTKRKKPNQIY